MGRLHQHACHFSEHTELLMHRTLQEITFGSPFMQQQYQIIGLMISGKMYRSSHDLLLTAIIIMMSCIFLCAPVIYN